MATRRTTRRSIAAAGSTGIENDVAAKGPQAATGAAAGKHTATAKTIVTTRATASKPTAKSAVASTSTLTAGRKRSAFADVTNGGKNKANAPATSANNKQAAVALNKSTAKVQPASSTTTRRTYRTRSSTGGSAVKFDDQGNEVPQDDGPRESEQNDDDAMMVDAEPQAGAISVPVNRPVKGLKRTASNVSTLASTQGATKKKVATEAASGAAARRAPLGSKRANTTASAAASTSNATTTTSKATLALRARQRREQAELRQLEAQREVEAARREEEALAAEEEQRRAKKARTSEPEILYADEEEEEVDDDVQEIDDWVDERPKDAGWEDLDEGDEEDPLMVSTYVVEVYEYLRELELTTMPDPEYMTNQNEVTWKMRGILLDWLVEIHTKFRLLPETIFLATNIIDRFLSVRVVSLVKFQLVGVTALFIAAKYEEVVCPSVTNFLYMTDGGYTDDEILKAERYVLSMIDFNLSYPNPINFLRRISKADDYDIQSRTMAKYLMEISVVDHRFMDTPPSLIAAAGNWLARRVLDKGDWDANLVHYSGYSEDEIRPTAQLMLDYVVRTSPTLSASGSGSGLNPLQASPSSHELEHPNFIKKYSAKKFFKASTSIRKWAEQEFAPYEMKKEGQTVFVPRECILY